jgi:tRNA-modifying protein YgfZ
MSWIPLAGWLDSAGISPRARVLSLARVSSIAPPTNEYEAVTFGCGLFDRSERGKLALTGAEAKTFLQGQISNDVEALVPGHGCYAAFLTPKGKMLGDLRVLDTGEELLLDTERSSLQELFNMIRRFNVGYAVELHKRTLERGLLSLIGPGATTVAGTNGLPEAEHSHQAGEVAGLPVLMIRTDLGIDVLCAAGATTTVAEALQSAGAVSIREVVAECRRVETGRPRYGLDLDDSVIPQEADLNHRAVSFTKGCYVGQETVARLFYRGKPNRQLRGVRLAAPAETGAEVSFGEKIVGRLGSVAESPSLGHLALALIRREAPPGSQVRVGPDQIQGVVVELPFLID